MKTKQTNTETNNTKKEVFLTKELKEKLISNLLDSQKKLAFYTKNRQEFPDRNYRNLIQHNGNDSYCVKFSNQYLIDREEENIYKINQILINNKF